MNTLPLTRILFAAIAATMPVGASAAVVIANASFEKPLLPAHGYEYGVQNGDQHSSNGVNARAPGTSFSNGAGVQSNGSAWGFAAAPAGRQTAFLQSYAGEVPGRITLAVTGLIPGKRYAIGFACANRPGYGVNPVSVSFDDAALGSFTPRSTRWGRVTTDTFEANSDKGSIAFSVDRMSGDFDIGIDNVTIAEVGGD